MYLSTLVQIHIYDMVIGLIYVFWHPHSRINIITVKSTPRNRTERRDCEKFHTQGCAWRAAAACTQGALLMSGCSL